MLRVADGTRKRTTRSARRAAPAGTGRAIRSRRLAEVLRKFRVLFKSSQRHSRWVETAYGVSPAQLWALTELARSPALRVAELALRMSLHVSTASNLLDKLERKALLTRARDRQDQRVVRLRLTAAGRRVFAKAKRVPSALLPDALARLPDALLGDLDRAMTRLLDDLAFKDEDAAFEPLNRP